MQNKNLIRGLNTRWGDIKLHTMLILDTISFALIAEDNLDMRSSEDLILKLQWKFFNSHFKKKQENNIPLRTRNLLLRILGYLVHDINKFSSSSKWLMIKTLELHMYMTLYKINEKSRQFTDEWKYDLRKKLQLNNKLGKNQ